MGRCSHRCSTPPPGYHPPLPACCVQLPRASLRCTSCRRCYLIALGPARCCAKPRGVLSLSNEVPSSRQHQPQLVLSSTRVPFITEEGVNRCHPISSANWNGPPSCGGFATAC